MSGAPDPRTVVNAAVVGLGYWGPHYARILTELPETHLGWCCDQNPEALELVRRRYPWARVTRDLDEVLRDREVQAVVVATPTSTHSKLALACLDAGKDILVEKPLAASLEECRAIEDAAGDRIVMVGHTFIYNAGIVALRELIAGEELGKVHYAKSVRAGLGPIREDVNVLWDLGPHDVSILLELVPSRARSVSAMGQAFLRDGVEDVVFLNLRFDAGIIAHAHLSWLDPYKVRSTTVIGDRQMAVFDDVALDERLKILDRGASYSASSEETRGRGYGELRAVLRDGAITIPRLPLTEPLMAQVSDFARAVSQRRQPYSDLDRGIQVVAVLEAADRSLKSDGLPVPIDEPADQRDTP